MQASSKQLCSTGVAKQDCASIKQTAVFYWCPKQKDCASIKQTAVFYWCRKTEGLCKRPKTAVLLVTQSKTKPLTPEGGEKRDMEKSTYAANPEHSVDCKRVTFLLAMPLNRSHGFLL
jgi:hypothetical protein